MVVYKCKFSTEHNLVKMLYTFGCENDIKKAIENLKQEETV